VLGPEELSQESVCRFLSTDLTMADATPAKSSLVSLVVGDGGKVTIFRCPSCKGNQVVELSDFSTGLETLFPAIDVASLNNLFFLTDHGLERMYHNDDSCVDAENELDEPAVRCASIVEFEHSFGDFVKVAWKLLGPMTVLYYERDEQLVEDSEDGDGEESTVCRNKQCIPVLSLKDVRSLGVVKRVIGSIDMEADGGGRIVEVESAGDVVV
jgi:hypothetical protein